MVGPQGFLGGIVWSHDDNLWFTEPDATGQLEYITEQGSVTVVPAKIAAEAISVGSDRRVWFGSRNRLGRVDVDGSISYFKLRTSNGLLSLSQGPDDDEWFNLNGGHIGYISQAGIAKIYQPDGSNAEFSPVVAGPDGNMWFTEAAHAAVDKLSVDGVFTEYPLPRGCIGRGLVVAGDENLWAPAVCGSTPEMLRVATTGAFKLFPVPLGVSNLVSYSSRYLWGSTNPHDLVRFDILTDVQSHPIPFPIQSGTSNAVGGMTIDHTGNICFTAYIGDQQAAEIVEYQP